ncbi:hypothetical protein PHJA_002198600, partial [Phtheirospermum japonicum]
TSPLHVHRHPPSPGRRHRPGPLATLPAPQAQVQSRQRRRLRAERHLSQLHIHHHAVHRRHQEPQPAVSGSTTTTSRRSSPTRTRAITPPVILPPLFHETKSTVALSPVIGGAAVPAAAELVNELVTEEGYGVVGLRLVLTGRLRYRAAWIRLGGQRGVYVRCDLLVGVKNGFVGQLPLLGSQPCSVDV